MSSIAEKVEEVVWQDVAVQLNEKGYSLVSNFLFVDQCQTLINQYGNSTDYRKTVVMERYRFGKGEYKYFNYPLPDIVQSLRECIYPKLTSIANLWMKRLKIDKSFPETLRELQVECRSHGQSKPTTLILKYNKGDFNTLHQDIYGDVYFPLQVVFFLSEPDIDFTGGEFVITQQAPRAQSTAIVLNPKRGDMLIVTTNFRPVIGKRGYYRENMKHGVSMVHSGNRYSLGVIFHDAVS